MALPGTYQYNSTALEASAQLTTYTPNAECVLYQLFAELDASGPASGYILLFDLGVSDAAPATNAIPLVPPIKVLQDTTAFVSASCADVPIALFTKGVRAYFQTGRTYQGSGGSGGPFIQFLSLVGQRY